MKIKKMTAQQLKIGFSALVMIPFGLLFVSVVVGVMRLFFDLGKYETLFERIEIWSQLAMPYSIAMPLLVALVIIIRTSVYGFFTRKDNTLGELDHAIAKESVVVPPSVGQFSVKFVIGEIVISLALLSFVQLYQADIAILIKLTFLLMMLIFLVLGYTNLHDAVSSLFNQKYSYYVTKEKLLIVNRKNVQSYKWSDFRADFTVKSIANNITLLLYAPRHSAQPVTLFGLPKDSPIAKIVFEKLMPKVNFIPDIVPSDAEILARDNFKYLQPPILAVLAILFGIIWAVAGLGLDYMLIDYVLKNLGLTQILLGMLFIFHFLGGVVFAETGIKILLGKGEVLMTREALYIICRNETRIISWEGMGKYPSVKYNKVFGFVGINASKIYFRGIVTQDRINLFGLENPTEVVRFIKTQLTGRIIDRESATLPARNID